MMKRAAWTQVLLGGRRILEPDTRFHARARDASGRSIATFPGTYGFAHRSVQGGSGSAVAGRVSDRHGGFRLWCMTTRLLDVLLDVLVPTCCLNCRTWQPVGALGLCRRCRSSLVRADGRRCRTCARTLPRAPRPGRSSRCGECVTKPPAFAELFTLYAYQPPLDSVVKAMKFSRRPYLGELFADEMWELWAERWMDVDLVVPVPLPRLRQRLRGFNQAEVIARQLASRLEVPTAQPLRRRRGSPQSREADLAGRRRNARRSFSLRHGPLRKRSAPPRRLPHRVLLVDDVVTSGATLQRCTQLLRRAGAREVLCAVVAHRPARLGDSRAGGATGRRNGSRRVPVSPT